ncbi:DUF2182 domain-containing protein [Oxalobacteraceae bacterium OM1]|nr:DUF2182 domain-containing protein [Oxalobacteraceae bacterium OM1]
MTTVRATGTAATGEAHRVVRHERVLRRRFIGACMLCWAAGAAGTWLWRGAMASMGETPMPGGWSVSSMWTAMCGQSGLSSALVFVAMWTTMMIPMMLPSLGPTLWRYRRRFDGVSRHPNALAGAAGLGYFCAWALAGFVTYGLGMALVQTANHFSALAQSLAGSSGLALVAGGMLHGAVSQQRYLYACNAAPCACRATLADAWCSGMRLGGSCVLDCLGLALLLVAHGLMDVRWMAAVAIAVTCERILLSGVAGRRLVGASLAVAGVVICIGPGG